MTHQRYMDISGWQDPNTINWGEYKTWAETVYDDQGNPLPDQKGKSHVAIKINEGTAGIDAHCHAHWNNALAAGVEVLILYHKARPDINRSWQGAQHEVQMFASVLGTGLRENDLVMLDFEQPPEDSNWAWNWLVIATEDLHIPVERTTIYANLNTVETKLQDISLAVFPLVLADWTFDPNNLPSTPPPFVTMLAVQYTDKQANIPGVPEPVDADVFLKPEASPPPPPAKPIDTVQIKADLHNAQASINHALTLLG